MDTLDTYKALADAYTILTSTRISLHNAPMPVWLKVSHATDYVSAQVKQLISE